MTYTGKVVSINKPDNTLVVKSKEGEKTFDVSSVTISGSLKAGSTVHVTYAEKEGKMVASSVSSGKAMTMKHEMKKEG